MRLSRFSIAAAVLAAFAFCANAKGEGATAGPALAGNRAPCEIAFSPDGHRAYVTEAEEGEVAVIDTKSYAVTQRLSTGGERPAGLMVSPDGKLLVVANSFSGSVAILNTSTGERVALTRLPGMPWGVAISPDGERAYVSVGQLDQVALLDLPSGEVRQRLSVGRRPRAMTLTPDGATLAVANLSGGSVSMVETEGTEDPKAPMREQARFKLKGVNARGIAMAAKTEEAYLTLMPAFNLKPTDDPREVWHNFVQAVVFNGENPVPGEDQWMDFVRVPGSPEILGTPDQYGIAVDKEVKHAWITVSGRDVLTRITLHDRARQAVWPIEQLETRVGANPRGLALSPDEKQVWVCNYLGNSISVVDAAREKLVRTVDLGIASRVDPAIAGHYLFNNAGLTRAQRFTCNSCHPDGGTDGLTWSFTHVKDGVIRRNSRDLRGGIGETAPFRWSGVEKHMSDFLDSEVTGLLGGPKPTELQKAELEAAINAFRLPPNPFRAEDGSLTAEALRGKALFDGTAACSGCHAGPKHGGTGKSAWIGTTPMDRPLDIPHLTGVYDSAPYLHDGRAETLEAIFSEHNAQHLHGQAHLLTSRELAALMRYVREL